MSHNKTRPARLDEKGDAQPLTTLIAHIPAGKNNMPHNVVDYELRDSNAHRSCPVGCDHRNSACAFSCYDDNEVRDPDYYNRVRIHSAPKGHMRASLGVLGIRSVKPSPENPNHYLWQDHSGAWHDCTHVEDRMVVLQKW